MQIDKISQEPARLRMLTAPFYGTFFPLEIHSVPYIVRYNDSYSLKLSLCKFQWGKGVEV